ncbi:hypothetical protein [Streptomyces chartreusis]|uniref:hypothetical protein n=1 Tax=Streptomyces chartreusis TaxID=1969 RepID=UPI003652C240
MTTPALHPTAIATKYATLKHFRDSRATGRRAFLGAWNVTRGEDGQFHVSVRIRGRDAETALRAFVNRQALFLSQRMGPDTDDVMPSLDVSQPGRTAAWWRLSGVWVEV